MRRCGAEPDDILVATELTKVYRESRGAPWRRTEFRAVDSVSFRLRRASTLAIVGESGSGKSTLARMVLGLLRPTSGTVVFEGTQITDDLDRDTALAFRRRIQPVLQNPYSSLDPRYTVYRAIEEPLRIHRIGDRRQRRHAVGELVDQVALPSSVLGRLPRELSGGQRQRVAIARALALRPDVLVCDEAVSALDVLVQAQILDLLAGLQTRTRPDLPVHQPRSGGGPADRRRRAGDARRAGGRTAPDRELVQPARARVHPRVCWTPSPCGDRAPGLGHRSLIVGNL